MQRLARQRKRDQLLRVLEHAESSDCKHQSRDYYKYIRVIAPKTRGRRICLQDADGRLQNPDQECQQLTTYVKSLFAAPRFELQNQEPLPIERFLPSEREWAIKQLKSHKAVPKGAFKHGNNVVLWSLLFYDNGVATIHTSMKSGLKFSWLGFQRLLMWEVAWCACLHCLHRWRGEVRLWRCLCHCEEWRASVLLWR